MLTLHLLGLPLARWRTYVEITHKINYTIGTERDATFRKFDLMLEEVARVATERRKAPRADLLTVLGQMIEWVKPSPAQLWNQLRRSYDLPAILHLLSARFKTSLLADYRCLLPWG